jgi:zinc/manganese transport system permease protein
MGDLLGRLFTLDGTGALLGLPFVHSALLAAALLGLVAGVLAPLIVARGMAFAVHGTAELAFTGGAAALLLGISVRVGAVAAGVVFGLLELRQRERDSVIGVVLAFGLGLGVLMVSLYQGRVANKFGLLTGSIVSVDSTNLAVLGAVSAVVLAVLGVCYRPLLFASTDPDVAVARGVPTRVLSPLFAVLIALTTTLAAPIVGAVIVLAVTVIPGASAARVTANPLLATVLAVLFAEVALLGGTVLSLAPGLPISGYVAAIALLCYLACRVVGRTRRRGWSRAHFCEGDSMIGELLERATAVVVTGAVGAAASGPSGWPAAVRCAAGSSASLRGVCPVPARCRSERSAFGWPRPTSSARRGSGSANSRDRLPIADTTTRTERPCRVRVTDH